MLRKIVKRLPFVNSVIKTNTYKHYRHGVTLLLSQRQNSTFTYFLRLPTQFDALSGPVIDYLLSDNCGHDLKIAVLGCSNGAEAYSIASVLMEHHPDLRFSVHGYDIIKEMVDKAGSASFTEEEVLNNKMIRTSFIKHTFDIEKDQYKIQPKIASRVYFDLGDALNHNLKDINGLSDIVFAQNFLFHLKPKVCESAFNNICRLLKHRAVLFIDGMDLDMRQKLTRRNGLVPLEYEIEKIHNEARVGRTDAWPFVYWGIEPFLTVRRGWKRRYSTIFVKN